MSKSFLALVGLTGFVLICFLCVQCHGERIEKQVQSNVVSALEVAGVSAGEVKVEGRNVVLRGELPSDEAVRKAVEAAGNARGVRRVRNELQVKAPPPPPRPVDEVQVALNELLAEKRIEFRTGSAVIARESYAVLDQIAELLKKRPRALVEIAGHTDATGNPEANLRLSQARADAVRQYLIQKGIPAASLVSTGYGQTRRIADNNTREGRNKNRRVEFNILEDK